MSSIDLRFKSVIPPLGDAELSQLESNILRDGCRDPLVFWGDTLIDGHNRLSICQRHGLPYQTTKMDFETDAHARVWMRDNQRGRRNLTPAWAIELELENKTDLAAVGAVKKVADGKAARDKQLGVLSPGDKTQAEPVLSPGDKTSGPVLSPGDKVFLKPAGQEVLSPGDKTSGPVLPIAQAAPAPVPPMPPAPPAPKHDTRATIAKAAGVSTGQVAMAERVKRDAPALWERAKSGEVSIKKAYSDVVREEKRAEIVKNLSDISAMEVKRASGVYDVIVIDPPWPMEKIERDATRPNQMNFDYPTMSEDQLSALAIPCADDCHAFIWTTHKYFPMAMRLLDKWALKYTCVFVWHKPGGFQPFDLPQFNCEFAIYARRGNPKFIDLKQFPLCFNAPRGGHSEKPEEFYAMLRRVTAGRRLDMFNRREIDGFDGYGLEAK